MMISDDDDPLPMETLCNMYGDPDASFPYKWIADARTYLPQSVKTLRSFLLARSPGDIHCERVKLILEHIDEEFSRATDVLTSWLTVKGPSAQPASGHQNCFDVTQTRSTVRDEKDPADQELWAKGCDSEECHVPRARLSLYLVRLWLAALQKTVVGDPDRYPVSTAIKRVKDLVDQLTSFVGDLDVKVRDLEPSSTFDPACFSFVNVNPRPPRYLTESTERGSPEILPSQIARAQARNDLCTFERNSSSTKEAQAQSSVRSSPRKRSEVGLVKATSPSKQRSPSKQQLESNVPPRMARNYKIPGIGFQGRRTTRSMKAGGKGTGTLISRNATPLPLRSRDPMLSYAEGTESEIDSEDDSAHVMVTRSKDGRLKNKDAKKLRSSSRELMQKIPEANRRTVRLVGRPTKQKEVADGRSSRTSRTQERSVVGDNSSKRQRDRSSSASSFGDHSVAVSKRSRSSEA